VTRLARAAKPALALLAGLSLALCASQARADDLTQLEGLLEEPVVSTASLASEDESVAPATSSTVTAEDLRRHGIRSLDEAINFLSLGMMTQNPLRSAEVGARGVLFTGDFNDHVLLLIDGHSMNELWAGTTPVDRGAGLPIEMIDHVEIVLGPGSVLYGSYAMLGVINVVTKRARDFSGVHLILDAEGGKMRDGVQGGLAGAGGLEATAARAAIGIGHEFTLFGQKLELAGQAQYMSQKGPAFQFGPQSGIVDSATGEPKRFGDRTPPGTWGGHVRDGYATTSPSVYARAAVGDFELYVRGAGLERRTPYINFVNASEGSFDDPSNVERERWASADLRHHARLSTWARLDTRVYGDDYRYETRRRTPAAGDCGPAAPPGCVLTSLGTARWVGLNVRTVLEWSKSGSIVTTAGVDGRVRSVTTHYETTPDDGSPATIDDPHPRYTDPTLGAYLQQTASPTRWLNANAGARADIDSRYGRALSPRAALAVKPWTDATVKGIFASAFRVPTTYEATYTETPGAVAPTLRPESVRSYEVSFEQRLGANRLLFGVFRNSWDRLIYYRYDLYNTTGEGRYDNSGSIDSTGFQASYEGALLDRRLRAGANVTGAFVRQRLAEGQDAQLPAAPSYFGNARIAYELPSPAPTLALAMHWTGAALADQATNGAFTPAPYAPAKVVGRATVSGAFPGLAALTYRLTAQLTSASRSPYVVGPNQASSPEQPGAQLAPIDRARFGLALQYDIQ
jgi:outer membrane receptor for ferrienterochelin and colicins